MIGPILLLLAAVTVTGIPETSMADLPLVEVPATGPRAGRLAVMLSGDGGWSALDKHVASTFATHGIDVVGLNSLKYLWKERSPDEVAQDVESITRHYMASWKDTDLVLLGYSSGADILPFVPPRMSADAVEQLRAVVLLAPRRIAAFEFHVSDWLTTKERDTDRPVLPEVQKIVGPAVLCFYGDDDKTESLCTALAPPVQVFRVDGGHHFGGDYDSLAEKILGAIH